jgi:hypothetical protein
MPRMLDLKCHACEHEIRDKFFMETPDEIPCPNCGTNMDRMWFLPRRAHAEWSDADAVVVFKDANGKIRYPGQNTAPTPPDCERVVMRSLRQVEAFERKHNVRSEMAWYDKGSGRGFDENFFGKKL